jgi:pyruvate dehydrogenase E1 component alpha subunit
VRTYLAAQGAWDKAREESLVKDCNDRVQAAVQEYIDTRPPAPSAMFEHLYEHFPSTLEAQRADLDACTAEAPSAPGSGAEQV